MSKREQLGFEEMMFRYRPGIHQRDRTNKVFLEGRRVRSRSMVAVTLRCRVDGSQVTQGWSINRRGCGCATWVCCGSEGEGETAGLRVGCSGGRVVKGRSDEGRRSTTVEGVGSGGTWRRRDWHTGWLGKRRYEVGGKALARARGHDKRAPLTDGDRARWQAVTRKAGILHWGGSTARKRNNQQTGERHESVWAAQGKLCPD